MKKQNGIYALGLGILLLSVMTSQVGFAQSTGEKPYCADCEAQAERERKNLANTDSQTKELPESSKAGSAAENTEHK